ncbi:TonB-dependent receptor [Komagataeibacter sp. FXV3]|uniref:TonB-dependent receptor domain-containing protein n=1 Tax=Komagataeibacter sp. FXV3 TaxID=2608998 RepID=UPI00187B248E|nr:TonB-dependent receptor [Komagataeibacter sp. FXV3]MBE7728337.1 TonB-dependent receptor [Komagataeibacter sp. FXV3]
MSRFMPCFRHSLFAATGSIGLTALSSSVFATPLLSVHLPAQRLALSLTELSRQSQRDILFSVADIGDRMALPVDGSMTFDDALGRLTQGSNLQIIRQPDGTVLITPQATVRDNKHAARHTPVSSPGAAPQENLIVLGTGQSRQVQTLSSAELHKTAPGTSPLATLSELPGVNFQSSDPLGAYEWAQQITVRGFFTDQLGYTMDGVPLGNMDYRNNNGLAIGRALENENNGPVTLAQGTGGLGTASTSNLGGTIQFTSVNPTDRFGIDVSGSIGSATTSRGFIKVNSGLLPGGGKFYVSYDYQFADKWKGWGQQRQQQLNFKYVQPLGEHVKATTFLDFDDRREDDYLDVSLNLINRLGYNQDDISNNYKLAEQIARASQNGQTLPAPYRTADDTYYRGGAVRQDVLGYEKFQYDIIPHLSGSTTIYGHYDRGPGTWADPYDPTPSALGGSPLSVSTTEYDMHREGVISNLMYRIAHHKIETGFWFENNLFEQAAKLYPLQAGVAPTSFEKFYSNPFDVQWQYAFRTHVYQFHLEDTWAITPHLRLNAGFKSLVSNSSVETIQSYNPINASISAADGFLPQAGLLYTIDRHNEVFGDFAQNMAAYKASAATGPFSTTQAGFAYIHNNLRPEKTTTGEIGYRFHNANLQASLTGYYVDFTNRLLTSSVSIDLVGNQNILENVGSVTSRGVEAAINWKFYRNWSFYGTWSYNDAHYNDNVGVPGSSTILPIAGKQVVATPRNIGNFKISYDDGSIWGQFGGQYMSRRFYTYLNNSPIPGRIIFNLSGGYRFHGRGWKNGLEMQLNLVNLFDKQYISSIGTNGFENSDPDGSFQTLQVGAPRQVFFTVRKHFF